MLGGLLKQDRAIMQTENHFKFPITGLKRQTKTHLDIYQHLVTIKVQIEDTNDGYVKNMAFQVRKESSGTEKVEK
eukprot:1308161-Ditylum_brightwellii.AAC.1